MKAMKTLWVALAAMTLAAPAFAGHHKKMDIVDTAANAGTFETLIAAAKAAGLAGALKGDGPLTVFAPTDDAFGALPAGTIESLLKPENKDQLATILKYHVIAGKVGSDALADGARLETLAGIDAVISQTEKGFNIENARIVATDIDASNGVVHVIDRVILPPAQMSRADAARQIQDAIDRGVPAFNHGNADMTVAVYKAVTETLMRSGDLTAEERARLEIGLMEAANASSTSASAWKLRYALDDVNGSLHGNGRMEVNTAMTR
ncbi:MAG: fasciclin domain-containing protein [Gammaproteobacteria bacterium]|nr:fasciclin domain-containing protein [Gammaproteobacteria bacterium]